MFLRNRVEMDNLQSESTKSIAGGKKSLSRGLQIAIFLSFATLMILSIALMNYLVNPYHVFSTKFNICDTYDCAFDRETVYPKLKLNRNKMFETVFCGSSSVMLNISDETLEKYFPNNSSYKLGVPVVSFNEQYDLIKNFLKANPEVKKIYISVDYDEGTAGMNENLLPEYTSNFLNKNELYFLLLSSKTSMYSVDELLTTMKEIVFPTAMFKLKKNKYFGKINVFKNYKKKVIAEENRYPRMRRTDWAQMKFSTSMFKELRKIKDLCEKQGKEVIFYTTPLHAYAIYDIYNQGVYDNFQNFKRELVKIAPFYDFTYICDISKKPVSAENPYWIDITHSDLALGDEILKKIVSQKGDYGRYVTAENIENELNFDKRELLKFARDNENSLKKFATYGHLDMYAKQTTFYLYE